MTQEEIASGKEFNKNALGFHKPGMWDKIVDIDKCHLQADPSNAIRNEIRRYAIEKGLSFFHPRDQSGFLKNLDDSHHIDWRSDGAFTSGSSMRQNLPLYWIILKQPFPQITSLLYVINNKANDTLYDQDIFLYAGTRLYCRRNGRFTI